MGLSMRLRYTANAENVNNVLQCSANETVVQNVVKYLRKPTPEIKKFDGNPMEYRRFLRQFNAKVVQNTETDAERMNYLEQLTSGEANKVVSGFGHLNDEFAYRSAMNALQERYGDNDVIVAAFIKKALEWPQVKDAKMLDEFSLFLVECENTAASVDCNSVLDFSENIKRLLSKLPVYMHDRWRNIVVQRKENKRTVKFTAFTTFLKKESRKANDPTYGTASLSGTVKSRNTYRQTGASASVSNVVNEQCFASNSNVVNTDAVQMTSPQKFDDTKCSFCSGAHKLELCKSFHAKSLKDKYTHLKTKGLCFGCLKKGHITKNCRNKLTCTTCGRRHPTPLHDETKIRKPEDGVVCRASSMSTGSDDKGAGNVNSCAMAIVPVRIKSKNSSHSILTYAFLDSGSSISMCTDRIMHELGLCGKRSTITLQTMGNPYEITSVALDNLQICDTSMNNLVDLPRIFTKDELPVNKSHIRTMAEIRKWPHLAKIEIPQVDAEIGLLIGNNVPNAYSPFEILTGPSGSPHGTRTRIGWIVWNVLRNSETHEVNRVAIESYVESDTKLEEMLRNSINIDFPERVIDDKPELSVEDKNFMDQVRSSIALENEHYSVALPLRNPSLKMPNNIAQAKQRLNGIERKLRRDEKFKGDYIDFMEKLFENSYAEEVPEKDMLRDDGRVWYSISLTMAYTIRRNPIK